MGLFDLVAYYRFLESSCSHSSNLVVFTFFRSYNFDTFSGYKSNSIKIVNMISAC